MFLTPEGAREASDRDIFLTPLNPNENFVLKINGKDELISNNNNNNNNNNGKNFNEEGSDRFCQQKPSEQSGEEQTEDQEEDYQEFPEHFSALERFRKTLYYGGHSIEEMPTTDRFSLSVTEIGVEAFARATSTEASLHLEKCSNSSVEEHLNRLDLDKASRLSKATCSSPTSLVLALLYLDRLRNKNPSYLRTVSSTDLFLVSLMVASKYLNDDGEDDEVFSEDWAEAAGIETKELTNKELDFLDAIDWSLYITQAEFLSMQHRIECEIAQREVKRRGWASYTDLMILTEYGMSVRQLAEILLECIFKVTTVCVTAYAASILAMWGTVFVLNKTSLGPVSVQSNLATIFHRTTRTATAKDLMTSSSSASPTTANGNNNNNTFISISDSDTPSAFIENEIDPEAPIVLATNFILSSLHEDSKEGMDHRSENHRRKTGENVDYRKYGLSDSNQDLKVKNGTAFLDLKLVDNRSHDHHTTSVLLRPNSDNNLDDDNSSKDYYQMAGKLKKLLWEKLSANRNQLRKSLDQSEMGKNQCPLENYFPFQYLLKNSFLLV